MDKICDIIICIWNQREITQNCIECIAQSTQYPYRLILIDNASDEETKNYLQSLKSDPRFEVILIHNEENLGNTKAVNQGLLATDAPYVCNLDNDTYVTEGWLTEMVSIAESDPAIGMVAPSGGGVNPPKSESLQDIQQKARELVSRRGEIVEMATADNYCALIKREVIEKVGVWDEIFSPGYFDDTDYCKRLTQAGFSIVMAHGAYVYHLEGKSFRKNIQREELFQRNKKIYEERYGTPKRILFLISEELNGQKQAIKDNIRQQASAANWVWIVQKKTLPRLDLNRHSHIKYFMYPSFGFSGQALLRILFRKKNFNQIFVTSPLIKTVLGLFKGIHKSEVNFIESRQLSAESIHNKIAAEG